jgi:HAD superfamily phosphoserine phosphatase-like hydrolase
MTPLSRTAFVFDFDGTISEDDVFDAVFHRYADPAWLSAHADYHAGEISLKEAYREMARHFRGGRRDFYAFLRVETALRKGFRPLLARLRKTGAKILIVSNGFDIYIDYLLRRWSVDRRGIQVRCHHAAFVRGQLRLSFRVHARLRHKNCLIGKAETVEELQKRGYRVCFFGNGYSDTPAARAADAVFARTELAAYCRKTGIDYLPLTDFRSAERIIFRQPPDRRIRKLLGRPGVME